MGDRITFSTWEPLEPRGSALRLLTTVERDGAEVGDLEVRVTYTALATLSGTHEGLTGEDVRRAAQAYAENRCRERLNSGADLNEVSIEIDSHNTNLLVRYL
jgi:hypothetical protein